MWSVPFNFNLRDSYYAVGMVYQKVIKLFKLLYYITLFFKRHFSLSYLQGKFDTSTYWFNQMYYGNNSVYKRSKVS